MSKLLYFGFPEGWYFLNCDNTELKRSSKINFCLRTASLGGQGLIPVLTSSSPTGWVRVHLSSPRKSSLIPFYANFLPILVVILLSRDSFNNVLTIFQVFLHGDDFSGLQHAVPVRVLPEEYGGLPPPKGFSSDRWAAQLQQIEPYFRGRCPEVAPRRVPHPLSLPFNSSHQISVL